MKCVLSPPWKSVLGGFMIHLVLGTLYVWGIITTAVTAHLRKYDPTLEYNQTLMVYATTLLFQGTTMFLGGVLGQRIGPRYTCLLGGYLIVLGTMLSSVVTSLTGLIFTNGVLFGLGVGICYTAPIVCATKWMPHRKGLVTGIIVGGFGGGACLFGLLATLVLQWSPEARADELIDGYYPSDSAIANIVPTLYLVLGVCYFVVITVGSFMMVEPPGEQSLLTHETAQTSVSADSQAGTFSSTQGQYSSIVSESPTGKAGSSMSGSHSHSHSHSTSPSAEGGGVVGSVAAGVVAVLRGTSSKGNGAGSGGSSSSSSGKSTARRLYTEVQGHDDADHTGLDVEDGSVMQHRNSSSNSNSSSSPSLLQSRISSSSSSRGGGRGGMGGSSVYQSDLVEIELQQQSTHYSSAMVESDTISPIITPLSQSEAGRSHGGNGNGNGNGNGDGDIEIQDIRIGHKTGCRGSSGGTDGGGVEMDDNEVMPSSSSSPSSPSLPISGDSDRDRGPREVFADPLGWHVATCFAFTALGGMYIAGTYKTFGQQVFDHDETFLSALGSTGAVFNASGRVMWGYIADRLGPINTLLLLSSVFSVLLFTYSFTPTVGEAAFALWTYAIFLFEGGNFALYMPVTIQLFGTKYAGSNYGLIFSCYSFCNVISIFTLADLDYSFLTSTCIMGVVTVIGFCNLLLLKVHVRQRGLD